MELSKSEAVEHLAYSAATLIHQKFELGTLGVGTASWYGQALEMIRS